MTDSLDRKLQLFNEIDHNWNLQCTDTNRVLKLCFSCITVVFVEICKKKNDGTRKKDNLTFRRIPSVPLEAVNMLWEGLLSLRKDEDKVDNKIEIWRQYISKEERDAFIETARRRAEGDDAGKTNSAKDGASNGRARQPALHSNPAENGHERKSMFFWDSNVKRKESFAVTGSNASVKSDNPIEQIWQNIVTGIFQETKPEKKPPQDPLSPQANSTPVSLLQTDDEIAPIVLNYIKDELKRLGLVDVVAVSGTRRCRNLKHDDDQESFFDVELDGVSEASSIATDWVDDHTVSTISMEDVKEMNMSSYSLVTSALPSIDEEGGGAMQTTVSSRRSARRGIRHHKVQYLKITQEIYQQYGIHLSHLPIPKGGFLIQEEAEEEGEMGNAIQKHEDVSNSHIWSRLIADSIASNCKKHLMTTMSPLSQNVNLENPVEKFYWLFPAETRIDIYNHFSEDVLIYIFRMFPHHLMHFGTDQDALELLMCPFFVSNRIRVLGIEDGLRRYQKDCELYFHMNTLEKTKDLKKHVMPVFYAVLGFLTTEYPVKEVPEVSSLTPSFRSRNTRCHSDDGERLMAIGKGLHRLATSMLSRDWEEEALEFYSEALRYKSSVADDQCCVALTLKQMVNIRLRRKDYPGAIELYEEVLKLQRDKMGIDGLSIAENLKYLGVAYGMVQEYEKAAACYEEELLIQKLKFDEGSDPILDTQCRLGMLYTVMKHYDDAYAAYNKCLHIYKEREDNDELLADLYRKMAYLLKRKGSKDDAISYYEKALNIATRVNGRDNIDVAKILLSMGDVFSEEDKRVHAINCYEESIKIRVKLEGENNQAVGEALFQLGNVYSDAKDYDKSLEVFQRVLHIDEHVLGNQEFVSDTLHNMGMVYRMKGDLVNAMKCIDEALRTREERLSKESKLSGSQRNLNGSTTESNNSKVDGKEKFSAQVDSGLRTALDRSFKVQDGVKGEDRSSKMTDISQMHSEKNMQKETLASIASSFGLDHYFGGRGVSFEPRHFTPNFY